MSVPASLGTIDMSAGGTLGLGSGDDGRASTIAVQTVGTWSGTLTIQATIDGTNYVAVLGVPAGSTTAATTIASAAEVITRIDATGYSLVRLSGTAGGSGSVAVYRSTPRIG